MARMLSFGVVAALFLCSLPEQVVAHPFHVSFAEVDWNAADGVLEVAVKIDPDDLESEVRLHCGKRIKIEDEASARYIANYLFGNLRFERPSSARVTKPKRAGKVGTGKTSPKYTWIGSEIDEKTAWLYFEIACPQSPNGMEVVNTLLANSHHPSNTIMVRANGKTASMTFTGETTKRVVRLGQKKS